MQTNKIQKNATNQNQPICSPRANLAFPVLLTFDWLKTAVLHLAARLKRQPGSQPTSAAAEARLARTPATTNR